MGGRAIATMNSNPAIPDEGKTFVRTKCLSFLVKAAEQVYIRFPFHKMTELKMLELANATVCQCLARATMVVEAGAPIQPTLNSPFHNHHPEATKGAKLVMMAKLKERATQEVETRVSNIE